MKNFDHNSGAYLACDDAKIYYEVTGNEASNSPVPVGLRCLEDKQKAMDSQLTEMQNSLKRLQDRLKQDSQIFRDNNKKILGDMDDENLPTRR